jgi:hypothetical protein
MRHPPVVAGPSCRHLQAGYMHAQASAAPCITASARACAPAGGNGFNQLHLAALLEEHGKMKEAREKRDRERKEKEAKRLEALVRGCRGCSHCVQG